MKREQLFKRILSLVLVLTMLTAYALPAHAAGASGIRFEKVDNSEVSASLPNQPVDEVKQDPDYADTDMVRVSIVLNGDSTIEAGYPVENIADNAQAMRYRAELADDQDKVTASIEKATGENLDVVWNMTLAANIISANVEYGQIEQIEKVPGVKSVLIETRYEPDVSEVNTVAGPEMATSSAQIGSAAAWASGYTGAGSRIAVIDTGIDSDHQSFNSEAFQYSLAYQAGLKGMSIEDYLDSLHLLDTEETAEYVRKGLLNVNVDPEKTYINSKIPFAYNYVDENYDITHDNDTQEEHGSHVEGIAAANAFIPNGDGTFSRALDSVKVQGVAPDAQIITMKVFGTGGGAYDSDYMVAIEDAIVLGADSINLSLGSGNPGMSRNSNATYQAIMDSLTKAGAVVCISAGNSGSWVENAQNIGYLYSTDVSMQTDGSPGSFTNSLAVASVNNDGATGAYVSVDGEVYIYNQSSYSNQPMSTIAGEQEYVLIDGFGTQEDWAAVGDALTGKVAICSRGSISFYQKGDSAVEAGAIATIVYNNAAGVINMDLSDYSHTQPFVSITQSAGAAIKAASTPVTDDDGNVLYYTGKMTISDGIGSMQYNSDHYTMSDFSSWGVPGSLELKPEITAPGGSIYSVWGSNPVNNPDATDQYESMSGTSMASPQVAGMAALVAQYIRENGLAEKTGLTNRQLTQSLLMSTAVPMIDAESSSYYPILQQGAGLANVGDAITADSYILMGEDATKSYADGKVKAELGDDPTRSGAYDFTFSINNLTDKDQTYNLYADFFTQDAFLYYANGNQSMDQLAYYMDTLTTALEASTTFTIDGVQLANSDALKGRDVNGDGAVNSLDGQAILDYAAGTTTELADTKAADMDGDGDVDSYDAYLFFAGLKQVATVPANGSVEVKVSVKLSADAKESLDAVFTNGTYIEGYVYAEGVSTSEGVAGTTHSIPVLGFYGKWSDASMFDVGSYLEYSSGDEYRLPYLGSTQSNAWLITYANDASNAYAFGGNPLIPDDTYMPERNAINSVNGDKISKVQFAAIRNAADSLFTATNATKNVVMKEGHPGAVSAAYYYTNGSTWRQTGYSLNTAFSPSGAAEGDKIDMKLTLAPEYYQDAEGNVDWDALGDGATFGISMTVDNTAPELKDLSMSLTGNSLTAVASDNQYVAAVVLYNGSGTKALAYCGAAQEADAGDTFAYRMSLDGVNGNKFLLQVFDYAMNVTTYKIDMQIGEPVDYTGKIFGFTTDSSYRGSGNRWIQIDPENLYFYYVYRASQFGGTEDFCATDLQVLAAEYVDGYVFMAANDGNLYVAPQDELSAYKKVGSCDGRTIVGMAFNYADGKLYTLSRGNGDASAYAMTISTVDTVSGEFQDLYDVAVVNAYEETSKTRTRLSGLAIDDDGNFYSVNYGTGSNSFLYTWKNSDAKDGKIADLHPINDTKSGATGFYGNYSTLAWDHDKDVLYMAAISSTSGSVNNVLVTLDTTTGKGTKVTTYDGGHGAACASQLRIGLTGLYIIPSGNKNIGSTTAPTKIVLNRTEASVLKGSTISLSAEVYPWVLEDTSVTWKSSDDTVATVDAYGNVSSVGVGTAVITATTNATPAISADCTITVSKLDDVKLNGLIYGPDSETYWSTFHTDTLPEWTADSEKSGAYVAGALKDYMLYVHDGSAMYGVDPDTFEVTGFGGIASSWIWSDAAPAPAAEDGLFDRIAGLCNSGTYFELVNPAEGSLSYFDLTSYFSSDPMAVLAYIGTDTYLDYPAEFFYMMTEGGVLYELTVYTRSNGSSYSIARQKIGETGMDLSGVSTVTGGQYASMLFDEQTGYLLISRYLEGDTADLWAVSPETLIPAKISDFGDATWPVVSLYQYNRATDLTVRLTADSTDLYQGDTTQLHARVIYGTTNQLTWSSSNEQVATVDQNGLVTAVGEGSATITATTVDTNKDGQTASASVDMNVKGLISVSTKVNAQITTADGPQWVTIDTAEMKATVNANAKTAFTGAGANAGKIYGTDSDFANNGHLYEVDPSNGYAETQGSACSADYAILDMTQAPALTFEATDENGELKQMQAFGDPIYVANYQGLLFLLDPVEGSISGWNLYSYFSDLAAIAYVGATTDEDGYPVEQFFALGADGTLYLFEVFASYDTDEGEVAYDLGFDTYGDIGFKFKNYQALSMAYDGTGLIIADASAGSAELYYVDVSADEMVSGKIGTLKGATSISGLYTDDAISTSNTAQSFAADMQSVEDAAFTASIADAATIEAARSDDVTGSASIPMGMSLVSEKATTGSLNATVSTGNQAVRPMSLSESSNDEKTVTVSITAKDAAGTDVASTNGVATVSYDPAALTLSDVEISGDYTSVNKTDGSVTFGYVSLSGIAAGETVAKLVFTVNSTDSEKVQVAYGQVNDGASGFREDVAIVYGHTDTEIRNAVAATCTTDGYTGDTYCKTCGKLLESGKTIPATGHDWSEWTVVEASCTEDGSRTRFCKNCDEKETEIIPAIGHSFTKTTVAPTCTADGYDMYECSVCGYSYRDNFVAATGHKYEKQVVPATCTTDGYTAYVCSACGDAYTDHVEKATGHQWGEWTVVDADDCFHDGLKSHTCAACGTEETAGIPAGTTLCPSAKFTDLDSGSYAHEAIDFVLRGGYMVGTSDTTFAPNANLTRGQLVSILYRVAGSPETSANANFSDVSANAYYAKAVAWASENGIVSGHTDGTFGANETLSRQDMVTFLYRFAKLQGKDVSARTDLSKFADKDQISGYATEAMQWAVASGMIYGVSNTELAPKQAANRAQGAVEMFRFFTILK